VTVSATVENQGNGAGTASPGLFVNRSRVERGSPISLDPGEQTAVNLSLSFDAAGRYDLEIGNASGDRRATAGRVTVQNGSSLQQVTDTPTTTLHPPQTVRKSSVTEPDPRTAATPPPTTVVPTPTTEFQLGTGELGQTDERDRSTGGASDGFGVGSVLLVGAVLGLWLAVACHRE
jgi:hypothetical protein